jgi:hypothetical protein
MASLRRERGELDLMGAAAAGAPFHLPDFLPFIEGVARAGMEKEDWVTAERYYRLLLTKGRSEGVAPDALAALERLVAGLQARAAAARR